MYIIVAVDAGFGGTGILADEVAIEWRMGDIVSRSEWENGVGRIDAFTPCVVWDRFRVIGPIASGTATNGDVSRITDLAVHPRKNFVEG